MMICLPIKQDPHFRVLTVGRVKFDVNVYGYGIELLSNLEPEDVKMQDVINYLNKIYNKGYDEQPGKYRWCMEEGDNNRICECGQVRLEPIRDGGTMVRFELCNADSLLFKIVLFYKTNFCSYIFLVIFLGFFHAVFFD